MRSPQAFSVSATVLFSLAVLFSGCKHPNTLERIKKETFGAGRNGEQVHAYTILNASGARIRVLTYGAILSEVWVPDRNNRLADVVLGYHSIDKYITKNAQFGTIVGRYGNRIANGRFSLDGVEYKLATNNGPNHLHGGPMGFDKKTWEAEEVAGENYAGVKLHYHSADGEEGYPGNLDVYVTYTLNDSNEIRIEYSAIADKPTVLNLTNHSYFNLKGQGEGNILDHELILFAEKYIPTDSTSIPLGPLADVEGTPFDFREAHQIGERIGAENNEQLKFGKGYDHSFVVNGNTGTLRPAARLRDSSTGRVLDVLTTEPAVQLYTGNNLNESYIGKDGHVYNKNSGVCLETQHYPDSPNRPEYPLTVLRPGQTYTQTTIFKFSVD